ncbi:MAG: hypothetical protein K1X55_09980 [Chitinophagales bacterium]|nr:hypothetical protein [Chitinophagales bacterium]
MGILESITKTKLFLISFILIGQTLYAQVKTNINPSNYYDYFCNSYDSLKGTELTTNWLRLEDAVPVMLDELQNAGYDWVYDRTIYKLMNGQYLNISAYSRKNNIGFLYIEGHDLFPSKTHRDILFQSDNSKVEYTECVETFTGEADFVKIDSLPSNIYILKEDCYFYQSTDNFDDNNRLITKEDALEILREDIRKYLKNAPMPK